MATASDAPAPDRAARASPPVSKRRAQDPPAFPWAGAYASPYSGSTPTQARLDNLLSRRDILARLAKMPTMTQIVNMHQAKTSLSRLIERALAGEEIVIARNGEPLVKLVPVAKERKRRVPGRYKGKIWIAPDCFEPMTEEELDLWEKWDH